VPAVQYTKTMSKDRRTVSLDPKVQQYLSESGVNASELVNDLVKTHMGAGGNERAMLELRREQVKDSIADLENQLESKRGRLKVINEKLNEYQTKDERTLEQADSALDESDLEERNQKVEYWAGELQLTVEEFVDRLQEYRST